MIRRTLVSFAAAAMLACALPALAQQQIPSKVRIEFNRFYTFAEMEAKLKELAQAGLVTSRKESRFIYYAANFDRMNTLLAYLTENCCGGGACAREADAGSSLRPCGSVSRNCPDAARAC